MSKEYQEFLKKVKEADAIVESACIGSIGLNAYYDYNSSPYRVGLMYFSGIGIEQDYSKAKEWLEVAASFGANYCSFYLLGIIYYHGLGVDTDMQSAAYWMGRIGYG